MKCVTVPISWVKGLDGDTVQRIQDALPVHDATDFFRRVAPSRAAWMALLKVGALDSFDEPRARTFWRLCRLEAAAGRPEPLLEAQPADFEIGPQAASLPNPKWEHELLGFPVSCHPLQYFAPHLDWRRYVPASHLLSYLGKEVDVCGLIVAERVHPTDRGPMKFLTLADYTGFVEAALFADVYRGFGHLTNHAVVALRATVDPFDNQRGFCLNAHAVRKP